jgi:hypothetical protein
VGPSNSRASAAVLLAAGLTLGPALSAQTDGGMAVATAPPAPLFASHEILDVVVEGPLNSVIKERGDDKDSFEGVVRYASDGSEVSVPVKLRTRGAFRLQKSVCPFPPIRVHVDSAGAVGTLFDGLDKIKMVTHCHDKREEYEQNALLEYLLYRTYNLFTEASFRARLARVTYIDAEAKRDTLTRYAFFIEPIEAVAARNGYEVLEVPMVPPDQMQQGELALYEVFQYMIGNTDWDPFKPKQGEQFCCHNGELIGSMMDLIVVPVPYDFDWSGVVNARYARPAEILGIRTVRQRRFWGICRPREEWQALIPVFQERQDAVYDLFREQPDLDPERLEKTLEYFDEFYELIADEDEVWDVFKSECRG